MITVEPDAVTVTYTDVHLPRAKFFTGLLRDFAVQWSGLEHQNADGARRRRRVLSRHRPLPDRERRSPRRLSRSGRRFARLPDRLEQGAQDLARTGSPRATRSRSSIGRRGTVLATAASSSWAAATLVASAVHHAAPNRIGFGERLDRALGRDAAVDFLKTVLRVSAEALLQGSSVRLGAGPHRGGPRPPSATRRRDAVGHRGPSGRASRARSPPASRNSSPSGRRAGHVDGAASPSRARRIEEKADSIAIEARSEIARFDAEP